LELNDELDPYPWQNDNKRSQLMTDNPPFLPPVMYHGPPSSPPLALTDSLLPLSITTLAPQIILSTNRLFFIAHKIGAANCSKWHLVRVAFQDSILLYPSALQDGGFLVEFYLMHPSDVWYNATNQQYWLQYSDCNGILNSHLDAHLITPSDTSEDRAARHNLHPVCCWVNLTHGDTYIHGLFEFATIRGRKTHNRVDQQYWDVLAVKCSMFTNKLPCFDIPTYSIHVDRGVHTVFPWMLAAVQDD
jgi:hypothetical protein